MLCLRYLAVFPVMLAPTTTVLPQELAPQEKAAGSVSVGSRVELYLNDVLVNTSDAAKRREPAYLGLQAEGGEQAFRNLRIRAVTDKKGDE
jgi:hypothetical protein